MDCLFFWHLKVGFQNKRLFSATSESRFSFEPSMIHVYLKMRADSRRDGIKREHVIFTQACLHSRQRRAWLHLCECFCQSNLVLGGKEDLKNCAYLWKNPGHASPCKVTCRNTNIHFIVLIFSLLAWVNANKDSRCCWCWKVNLPHISICPYLSVLKIC